MAISDLFMRLMRGSKVKPMEEPNKEGQINRVTSDEVLTKIHNEQSNNQAAESRQYTEEELLAKPTKGEANVSAGRNPFEIKAADAVNEAKDGTKDNQLKVGEGPEGGNQVG